MVTLIDPVAAPWHNTAVETPVWESPLEPIIEVAVERHPFASVTDTMYCPGARPDTLD
ncbi:hypothetical protein D3C86_1343020 [compost metagenome]